MRFLFFVVSFLFISSHANGAWININSGINDDLTSISFLGTTGLITGKKGVYISTNGGTSTGSWVRIENYLTGSDSIVYNHAQLYGSTNCYPTLNKFFFCGEDTVTHNGVIFEYNLTTAKIALLYNGPVNSRFNDLAQNSTVMYVVGNNGLIVSFDQTNPVFNIVTTNFNHNLNSISITTNYMAIGAGDYMIRGLINPATPNTISFTQEYYQNRNFKDILMIGSINNLYVVGKNLFRKVAGAVSEPHQYYADSLDANTIITHSSKTFIGTSSGIYRSYNSTNILEFQSATSGYDILGIQATGGILFACGKNGVILYTSDLGGEPEPYAEISYNGGCFNSVQSISSNKGTVTGCSNYINNVYINSSCSNYGHTFSTTGLHEIKLTVYNGSYSKTITKNITIVAIPQINLLTDVADTILCKQEVLDIMLSNTENNVYYTLYKTGSSTNYGNSPGGNGSDLNFQSNTLSQAGTYYIRATSSIANCSKNFTDLITIQVEKPVSKIYFDIINSEVNEDVHFYQKSSQASNFEWHFTNSPALYTSNLENPTNSFSGVGSSQVTLISGTNNNCFDSITIRGPFIYQPYTTDTSWLLLNSRTAPLTNNTTIGEDIIKTVKSRNGGYLVIGNYLHRQVNSRVGDSVNLPGFGQYVAKYNDYGILKWCIKTKTINQSAFGYRIITDLLEDSQGNVFVTGNTNSSGFIDNKGDTLLANSAFLLKLDSLGKTIWSRSSSIYQSEFLNVNRDYDDNIYLSIGMSSVTFPFLLNEAASDTISHIGTNCPTCNGGFKIVKLDNNGIKLSDFMIEISSSNDIVTPQVVFDSLNNMYLWGSRELYGVIYEPSTGDTIQLYNTPTNYRGNLYICKFDINGNYQWKIQGYTKDVPNDLTEIFALIADESGNLYATGQNDYNFSQTPHIMVNADNSQTEFYGGKYFITKISPDGITQWIKGNSYSDLGMGLDVLLDGDTIYTVGMARLINNTNLQQEFYGINNLSVSVNSSPYNYFVNKYAINGEILAVFLNSPANLSTGQYLDINNYPDLIKLNDGYFLLNKSVSIYNAPNQAVDFGFDLPYTGFPRDGTQLKIKLNQGVEFLPQYLAHVYDTICYGSSYVLSNGMELENLTSAIMYEDSLIAVNGIDSIIRYHIFVNSPTIHYTTVEVCFGENYEIPNDTSFTNIQSNFVYDQLIVSPNSCDSIIRHEFVVHPVTYTMATMEVCKGDDIIFGNGVLVINNIQQDSIVEVILPSFYGCDSTVNMYIHVREINELVVVIGNQLIAQEVNSSYQWVDCNNNFASIPGQQFSIFAPAINGNYAVVLNNNVCIDTSACYLFDFYNNLSLNELENSISISPNPTKNKTSINFGQTISSANILVYSADGRKILEATVQGIESYELDLTPFKNGTYFLRIATETNQNSEFIIVKN